jgi:hypothetical protein
MEKEKDILDRIGGKSGFRVPDNYFEQFNARMAKELPEREIPAAVVPTRWQRLRPYVYMAAMFAGVWLMMKMFTGLPFAQRGATADDTEWVADEFSFEEYLMFDAADAYERYESLYADNDY